MNVALNAPGCYSLGKGPAYRSDTPGSLSFNPEQLSLASLRDIGGTVTP